MSYRPNVRTAVSIVLAFASMALAAPAQAEEGFVQVPYNHPGLVADLGVGLWAQPLPMDYDGDGDLDLLVATADKPSNGVYFFENPTGEPFPVFKPGVRVGPANRDITMSYLPDGPLPMTPGRTHPDFKEHGVTKGAPVRFDPEFHQGRAKQWQLLDYDGDGARDLIVGTSDWREYGWDNAYTEHGEWTNGPLHGYVYFMRNTGSNADPEYAQPVQLQAGGEPLDVYGCPSPSFADWDHDGDLDLICGEFLDKLTYFENTGTRTAPRYAPGHYLRYEGRIIHMDLEMLRVTALDWDGDGDSDLIVGQEDGRVAWLQCLGTIAFGQPQFLPPRFFQQEAAYLKVGALSTPSSIDWDGDGDEDLIVGDTAGYVSFVENLDGGNPPRWAKPVYLKAAGETIRIQAGKNGSIQGPAEAKWGYTVLDVADWDHDGLPDIVLNSIWGQVLWYRNVGTRTAPELAAGKPLRVDYPGETPKPAWFWWEPGEDTLATQWRTSPMIIDLNEDGMNDLVMLDQEGYLAFFERTKRVDGLALLPPKRIFEDEEGNPLRLNEREAGKSGRRKLALCDWDRDGKLDLLANSKNIDFYKNVGDADSPWRFKHMGLVDDRLLAGHTTCPTTVDWNGDGAPELFVGAEDGFFYHLPNPHAE